MKELYISPEANIIAFAPMERLATTDLWGQVTYGLFNRSTSAGDPASDYDGDIGIVETTEPDIKE